VLVSDQPDDGGGGHRYWDSSTDQIIVTRNAALLSAPAIKSVADPLPPRADFRVWTDDFYNMLHVLKR
jgi:hypothetical protein